MDATFQTSSDAPPAPVSTDSDHKSIARWARETRLGNAIAGLAISSALFAGCASESGSRDGAVKSPASSTDVADPAEGPTTTLVLDVPTTQTSPTIDVPTTDTSDTAPDLPEEQAMAAVTELFERWYALLDNPADFASDARIRELMTTAVWNQRAEIMAAEAQAGGSYQPDPRDAHRFEISPSNLGFNVEVCVTTYGATLQNGAIFRPPSEQHWILQVAMVNEGGIWKAGLINEAGQVPSC